MGFGILILIVIGVVALFSWALATKAPATGTSGYARVNLPAADFTLPLFSGGDLALSSLRGQPVVINFWASWCPPCREEAPILEKVWRDYKDKGVTFIGIDIQDTEAAARAYIKEFDITYPNVRDEKGRATIDYGVSGIPVTFFIDRNGVIISRWVGAINERLLVARIGDILK
ncbi:MAG: TlpA family protein disulfide reductase [Chloroflexi bacterium]|nr:TlpA family protein disulfide reductase [Chloroflexota bacterium]